MAYGLEEFCADCRASLRADPGPGGRERIRQALEKLLVNQDFLAAHCGPDAEPGRHTLYHDPELDFHVLAHIHHKANVSPPHDHGPSWAVYGQAVEHTDVTEWQRVDDGPDEGHAELEPAATYRLEPGKAGLYDVGVVHTVDYPTGARFIRVTGTDLDHVRRLKFDLDAETVEIVEEALGAQPTG
jgi:predicted metal-dependent enzyme (double-stranded beta helix superfamily)